MGWDVGFRRAYRNTDVGPQGCSGCRGWGTGVTPMGVRPIPAQLTVRRFVSVCVPGVALRTLYLEVHLVRWVIWLCRKGEQMGALQTKRRVSIWPYWTDLLLFYRVR